MTNLRAVGLVPIKWCTITNYKIDTGYTNNSKQGQYKKNIREIISHFLHRAIGAFSIPHRLNFWQNGSDNSNVRTINLVEIYFLIVVEHIEHGPFLAIV